MTSIENPQKKATIGLGELTGVHFFSPAQVRKTVANILGHEGIDEFDKSRLHKQDQEMFIAANHALGLMKMGSPQTYVGLAIEGSSPDVYGMVKKEVNGGLSYAYERLEITKYDQWSPHSSLAEHIEETKYSKNYTPGITIVVYSMAAGEVLDPDSLNQMARNAAKEHSHVPDTWVLSSVKSEVSNQHAVTQIWPQIRQGLFVPEEVEDEEGLGMKEILIPSFGRSTELSYLDNRAIKGWNEEGPIYEDVPA